jgi:hypothetical protein
MPKQPEPKKDKPKKSKPITQRKSGHKNTACRRGKGVYYDEKKRSINISLTPTSIALLEDKAVLQGCSRSEVFERWLRAQPGGCEADDSINY